MESHVGIREVYLLAHRRGIFVKSLEQLWFSSRTATGASLIADTQALLTTGDDLLASKQDEMSVITVGTNIRIQRLSVATLVVITQPPHTYLSCRDIISACSTVLGHCKLMETGI